jgi:raffinose/stachyose/melibiose transport system substrate-binding protein
MDTKKFVISYVLIIISLILAACAGPAATPQEAAEQPTATQPAPAVEPTATQPAPATTAPEVVIHYLTVQQEDEGWPKIIGELTSEYQADHPNVKWEYENIPQTDLVQKVQLLAGSDSLPLMFNYESGAPLLDLVNSGQVLELEQTFKDLGIYEELNPGAVSLLKGLVNDVGLYALPLELNIEGFWYNKQIFADNGLEVPITWDEMLQAAETLQQNDIQPFAVSGFQKWPITRLINGYVMRKYGYDVMARVAAGELKVTDPGFIEAAQVVQDMGLKGYFGEGVNTLDYGPAQDLFLQGKAAMFYMGSWAVRDFNNPEVNKIGADNIGFFNIPLVEGGVGTLGDYSINAGLTTSFSKAKYEENAEGVGDWMKFVFSNYGDRAMSDLGLITGFRVEQMPAEVPPLTQMTVKEIDKVENGAPWFEARFNAKTQSVATDNAQLLITGDMTPEEYMTELQKAIDEQ